MVSECAAKPPNGILPAFACRERARDGVVTRRHIALPDRAEESDELVKAERFLRMLAKVPLVTRQTSPPSCLSIGVV